MTIIREGFSIFNYFKGIVSFKRLPILGFIIFTVSMGFTRHPYVLTVLITANIWSVYAASWDLLSGYAGQHSFGHAVPFGFAAYTSAMLDFYYQVPVWLTIPLGATLASLFNSFVGLTCLRLRGAYQALGTLAFSLILGSIVLLFPSVFRGAEGFYGLTPISSEILTSYFLSFLVLLFSILALVAIVNSRLGTIFKSIREDEVAAEAAGVNTAKYKILAFLISGFFAGLMGSFYTHFLMVTNPGVLSPDLSFSAIIYGVVGGVETIYGSVVGAYFVILVSEFLRFAVELRLLFYFVSVVIVLRFAPRGLMSYVTTRLRNLHDWVRGEEVEHL